jgi:hypothetical protein
LEVAVEGGRQLDGVVGYFFLGILRGDDALAPPCCFETEGIVYFGLFIGTLIKKLHAVGDDTGLFAEYGEGDAAGRDFSAGRDHVGVDVDFFIFEACASGVVGGFAF